MRRPGSASRVRGSVYQFSETAANLLVEGLFYVASVRGFNHAHERIKLAFQ